MKFVMIGGSSMDEDTTKIMIQEAKKFFDTVLYVPMTKVTVELKNGETKLFYKNQNLLEFDAAYVRAFGADFLFAELLLDSFTNAGVYTPSTGEAFQITNHKYYTVKVLSEVDVPVLDSSMAVSSDVAKQLSTQIGYPIVLKLLSGFGGQGVMLIEKEEEFTPITDTLKVFKEFISTQKYIESNGRDIRYYVLGDDVFAVQRKGVEGEFRANVSGGGSAKPLAIKPSMKKIAIQSARLLGLDICAVDFLDSKKGPVVVEINFTPGILRKYFRNQIARKMMEVIYEKTYKQKEYQLLDKDLSR